MDAILWLTDILLAEKPEQKYCLYGDLEDLVRWWYPQINFSRIHGHLVEDRSISQEDHPDDRRMNRLWLTDKGRKLLKIVKDDREKRLKLFLEKLTEEDQTQWMHLLEKLAEITWRAKDAVAAEAAKAAKIKSKAQGLKKMR